MKRITPWGWQNALAALALSVAIATGAGLAWAQTATQPAPAVTPANKAAAVDAFKKARDLYTQDKFAEANAQNEQALKLDPTNSDALLLRRILSSKVTAGGATEPAATHPGSATPDKVRLLKPTDISLIRIHEMTAPEDKQLKGQIDRKTLDSFWNEVVRKSDATVTKDAQNKFVDPNRFMEQVQAFKDSGNVSYMEKITFNADTASLLKFKNNIQPFILQNCASAACHGGDKAGTFRLLRPIGNADLAVYTNFYILSTYTFGGGKMIDRDTPDKSLLVQYGLPKTIANFSHPKVDLQQRFNDTSVPEYQGIVAWIKSLSFPRPNYGIIYEMPTAAPATAPAATAPATTTAPKPPATRPATKTGG